jgi:tRNA threonylcarbamoyl adenosine modification protein YeaZ
MILALDTSLADLHVGLFSGDAVRVAEFHRSPEEGERGIYDAYLAQCVAGLLKEHDVSANDISHIVLIIGPGSFTGLRIGLAFAKGLAFGSGAKIIPVTAHEAMLAQSGKISDSAAILYPGYEKDAVYCALAGDITNVRYMTTAEAELLYHITISNCPIQLSALAQMAVNGSKLPADIATLEPFYGTDFKATVSV